MPKVSGKGTKESPCALKTPPGTSDFEAYRDEEAEPPALVVQVGKTQLRYHLRCIDDLPAMLRKHGDWMPLGSADEQRPAAEGTVEAWGRTAGNLAAHAPGDDTPRYFILLEWDQGVITSIRDFRYVPYIAQEADLG